MTTIEARIILKKREACMENAKRARCLTDNSKRCSTCPYFTKLDDYISARAVLQLDLIRRNSIYGIQEGAEE